MPGDMDPIRTPEQIRKDQVRTGQQIRQLGEDPTVLPDGPPIDVDAILKQRHDAAEGALKFEPVARLEGGQTFVRSGEFVVRVSDLDETGKDDVHLELSGNRLFTRTGLTSEDPRYIGLQDLAWVYSSEGGAPPPGPNGEDPHRPGAGLPRDQRHCR